VKTETDAERRARKRARKAAKVAKSAREEERRLRREARTVPVPAKAVDAEAVLASAYGPAADAAVRVKKKRKRAEEAAAGGAAPLSLSAHLPLVLACDDPMHHS
jgi:hypothetical protein